MKLIAIIGGLAAGLALAPSGAAAQLLELPGPATQSDERLEVLTSYRLPIGSWQDGAVQTIWAEGELTQQAWQVRAEGMTTLQILAPLRAQLEDAGFQILFECEADSCGGFDFRYATDVLPEPAMHVDLGDYRFLSAQRMGEEKPEYISLMVSRSSTRGYVQICRIGPPDEDAAPILSTSTKGPLPGETTAAELFDGPLADELELRGRAVLSDLEFETGSSALGEGDFATLAALADYLLAHPERTVTLVGHTDAEGSLDGNIALSRRRAQSVMRRLVNGFGVPSSQIRAQGVGYLAPLTSNQTEDGRSANRRVEAILTSISGE